MLCTYERGRNRLDIRQFEASINKLFHNELLEDFDDDYGFTNKSNNSISTIGYSTNLSLETIERAAEGKADLMITHHDAWDFIYGLKEECMKKLKEYNISHFWIHGPLDYIPFGTCTSLMNVLGIDRTVQYSTFKNGEFPGIGEYNETLDFYTLVEKMNKKLNERVRVWRNNKKDVKRIGLLTGAGHSTNNIKYALEKGCDTYITGEATLYSIQYAQYVGINLIAGSHTFTEIFGVESLAKKLVDLNQQVKTIQLKEDHFELNQK